MVRGLWSVLICIVAGLSAVGQAMADSRVGVFYFPGWKEGERGLAYPKPWDPIRAFPDREPLLSWYAEGEQAVMDQHLDWMSRYGLGLVVFDWYWDGRREVLGHAVSAYLRSDRRHAIPYSLMWANHGAGPKQPEDFALMVEHLVKDHFAQPTYFRIDDMPVFFVMLPERLEERAQAFSSSSAVLNARLQDRARQAGLKGVLLVAGAAAGPNAVTTNARRWGYAAIFAYNYHSGPSGRINGEARTSHTYAELANAYMEHWDWFLQKSELPYLLPLTSGWDKRPWGGSRDPAHDQSVPRAGEFRAHLEQARLRLDSNPAKTLGIGLVCCWNEFGEGSIVEPTKQLGFQRLEDIRDVFSGSLEPQRSLQQKTSPKTPLTP